MPDCLTLGGYTYNACPTPYANKIVSLAIFLIDAVFTTYSKAEFDAQIATGDVKIIKGSQGSYDGGNPVLDKGYGEQFQEVVGNTHKLTLMYIFDKDNIDFYNQLMLVKNKGIAFVTGKGELMHVVDVPVAFAVKMPVTEDLDKKRQVMIEVTWSNLELPLSYDVPANVF